MRDMAHKVPGIPTNARTPHHPGPRDWTEPWREPERRETEPMALPDRPWMADGSDIGPMTFRDLVWLVGRIPAVVVVVVALGFGIGLGIVVLR